MSAELLLLQHVNNLELHTVEVVWATLEEKIVESFPYDMKTKWLKGPVKRSSMVVCHFYVYRIHISLVH